jgi:hypothetical protein
MDAIRFFSKNATVPEPMDATEQYWNNMAYSGGHIFGVSYQGDAICYDKNSYYPSILYSTCKIPLVRGHLENVKNEDIKRGEDGYYFYDFGIYRANVEVDKTKRKFFKHKGKNVYYCHHDLNAAVRCGLKVEIIQDKEPNAYLYDKIKLVNADRVFKEFVEYFYKLKVSGNKYAKMFLNNLSGLMGRKKKVYKRANKNCILEVRADYNLIDIDHNHEQDTTTGIMTNKDHIFCVQIM